jgi:hypothetical protein
MSFLKTGSCPKCGAPIWIPQSWNQITVPPPITYSCLCNDVIVTPMKFQELQTKVEKLEKELETLKKIAPGGRVKKELLKG